MQPPALRAPVPLGAVTGAMIPIYAPAQAHSTGQRGLALTGRLGMPKMLARSFQIRREAGRAFIDLTSEMERGYEFEIGEQALPALGRHPAEAFGLVPAASQSRSLDTAAQILSFPCECDPEKQLIVLRFDAANRPQIVMTLPAPRAREVFESIGKALTIVKSEQ